jgi:hypothetical protein
MIAARNVADVSVEVVVSRSPRSACGMHRACDPSSADFTMASRGIDAPVRERCSN